MSVAHALLPEFDVEIASTRKILALVPEQSFSWRPHPKSMTLQTLASHVVECIAWTKSTLETDQLDFNPPEGPRYESPSYSSVEELLSAFDSIAAEARQSIENSDDARFFSTWSLLNNGAVMMTMPKVAVVRSFVMNHLIHHRAQLGLYLRLLDQPLPGVYGPTADSNPQG